MLLLGVSLSLALVSGGMALRSDGRRGRSHLGLPVVTFACVLTIALFTIAQFANPLLLPALMRDGVLVRSGQPWRLATSLLVQDGGRTDAIFNLLGLLVTGVMAERLLGSARWALVAVFSVAAAQVAALAWQPLGAGNSILNFGLAGSICAACFMQCRAWSVLVPATTAAVCFAVLVAMRDIHGAAAATGMLALVVLARRDRLSWRARNLHVAGDRQ